MVQVTNEELAKIAEFIADCNDMIKGKFILADLKVTKILNKIAESEELYRFVSECMNDFDFSKELHRAEMKNSMNGGVFSAPQEPAKLVAFVFCFLVECDAKRIDFYSFINENFISKDRSDVYLKFAQTLLVPFRDIIANHFGFNEYSQEDYNNLRQNLQNELQQDANLIGENNGYYEQTSLFENDYVNENFQQENGMHNDKNIDTMQTQKSEEKPFKITTMQNDGVWNKIPEICDNIKDCIVIQRHMNAYLKEELNYIIDTIKYSTKYKDPKITSALVTAFDEMSKKFRSIQFVFGELKNEIQNLYK